MDKKNKKLIPLKDDRAKVLLVDDLKDNLIALEGLLRRDDVEVFTAKSGIEALEFMIVHDFAVALIDVQMPGMSGFELAVLMRGTKKTKNVPIIFVTATATDQSFSFKGYESGAVDFLLKPLDTHAVKSKVKIFIEFHNQKKKLISAEEKFRGLLETAPDAIVIVNEAGRIELVNQQTELIFGYERSELINQPMEILIPERFRDAHVHHRTGYSANPTARSMGSTLDLYGRRKDGSEFPVNISLSPLKTENGMLFSSAIRDITAQRASEIEQELLLAKLIKTQSELEHAVQMRDEFMSIASHELKTPLTSLKLQSQLRRRYLQKGEISIFTQDRLTKMFDADEKQFIRITHLIDDMLDISRIGLGKLSMSLERFDLCELVQDLVDLSSEQFILAGCPVTVDVCEPAFGTWDRFRIEQVVMNLLTNAMRYGAGKPIQVQVSVAKNEARITVLDHGRGVAKENHERIFQRFERAVSGSEISGLGLGLYIVKQILEAHHGSIRLESELGHGAKFVMGLPFSSV